MGVSNVKQEANAMDDRLDAMFEGPVANEVKPDTERAIYNNLRAMYNNQLVQYKAEMKIALRLNDKDGQTAIREAAKKSLIAIEELDAMLSELVPTNGNVSG